MTNDTKNREMAYRDAQVAIEVAQAQGLLSQTSGTVQEGFMLARMEMLSQALVFSRNGTSVREKADRRDWEYAQLFGYLTRLAIFEILTAGENQGWERFRELFRHYFGSEIDKLAPSIFFAAVLHPDVILSQKLQADVENISRAVAPEETAYQSLQASGLFD